jgi:hypothetical protein
MITNTRATTPLITLGDRTFRRYAAGLGLISVSAMLALSAKIVSSPGVYHAADAAPISSRTTNIIVDDLMAIHSVLPVSEHRFGSGYVVFEPAPAGPDGTVGLSHASPTNQTDESDKPADPIVAQAQSSSSAGE